MFLDFEIRFEELQPAKQRDSEWLPGGLAEGFATFGFAAMLVMQVTAAVLLVRSFSKDYWGRSIVAIASLICSAITLLMIVALIGMRFYFGQ
jgi:hypothetical protein